MLLELSEVLACPACGPPQVMVAVVQESEGHRVRRGFLGCPTCDSRYSIDEGVVQLGGREFQPSPEESASPPECVPDGGALLVGAVLDLARGHGYVLLGPELAGMADEVAAVAGGWEVVSLAPARSPAAKSANVSRIVMPKIAPLPALPGRFGAAALAGEQEAERIREFANALGPFGRLAIVAPGPGGVAAMREAGLEVLASDERVAVASRRA